MSDLDGPLSDQVLDRLRASAAMVLAVPHLGVKVRADDTVCLEVRRTPAPGAQHPVIAPCRFHGAVSRAVRMRRSGERIAMRNVRAGCDPAIDWGVSAGAAILPGGVVRVADADAWHHVAAVVGDPDLVGPIARGAGLDVRHDDAVEVSLVHGCVPRRDKAASWQLVDAIHGVLGAVGVADLERRLGAPHPSADDAAARR